MTIEQPSHGQDKRPTKEKIDEFGESFQDWLKQDPEINERLKVELLQVAGVSENELVDSNMGFDMSLVKVPVGELSVFGTATGKSGNKAFSGEAVGFLSSKNVEYIVGVGENNEPIICSAAINISDEDAARLTEIIEQEGGSLRADSSQVSGWSIFECE